MDQKEKSESFVEKIDVLITMGNNYSASKMRELFKEKKYHNHSIDILFNTQEIFGKYNEEYVDYDLE